MTAPAASPAAAEPAAPATRPPRRRPLALRVLSRPVGLASAAVLAVIVVGCLGAGLWAPFDPLSGDLSAALQGPSAGHLLGTDQLGRDVLSRLLYGGGAAFSAALQVAVVALTVAVPLGLVSGYAGGRTDQLLMRLVDFGLAVPTMIIVLVVLSIFSENLEVAYLALGLLLVPPAARIIRGASVEVRGELYIDAARVSGVRTVRIIARHVLPRVRGPILVQASLILAMGILMTGGLAYLGFGPPPPEPSWGGLIAESLTVVNRNPWILMATGGAMGLTVLALGLLGDAIRDESVEAWAGPAQRAPRATERRTAPAASSAKQALSATEASSGTDVRPHDPGALLSVRGLQIAFQRSGRDVVVASEVTFSLAPGEILGLVGESGCGKTSVARSVIGLLRGTGHIAGGEIVFRGKRVDDLSEEGRRALRGREIGFVSQEPMAALDPTTRVGDLVTAKIRACTGVGRQAARERMLELFRLVRLRDPERVAGLYPHQVSGGMAQRVAIARALAGNPALLVADEPTTALDVSVQAEILDLLRALRDETGMAVLVVTHDWGVVAEICERAVVMYAGQIMEQAPVERLLLSPRHPYTAALLRSLPSRAEPGARRLPAIPGSIPPPEQWPTACLFADRCDAVTDACREQAVPLTPSASLSSVRCLHPGAISLDTPSHPSTADDAHDTPPRPAPADTHPEVSP
ncbi:dipeptide/oligopeptide/nickel ABC transporter permease/ATP-binding protein [Streptomyces sp. AS02]|uniref:dipeptide/oligopeptide/nickel ABC transporter permease/ATP-binding protein n=1 Tax=Streptomyces sp. AS02 TaxID=2938946 RepID=UPI00202233A3|nr:dipeptide/oligopeptide/nickel ABC transporter permease/ATP-binding protein [Streptomyces sp. AS02]MCL8017262.1 dipeptide/oligopeptide/nickel ABC transporter permease/ATP-binding protein [Streptomyces sp. AS02]